MNEYSRKQQTIENQHTKEGIKMVPNKSATALKLIMLNTSSF